MDSRWQLTATRAAGSNGILRHSELMALGWSRDEVRHRVRRGEWVRLLAGTLLVEPSQVCEWSRWAELPLRTRVAAARAYHGAASVFVGLTAARLLGIGGLPDDDGIVHVRLPPGLERHQQSGVRLHTTLLDRCDLEHIGDIRCTSVRRTVTDLVLSLPRPDAISVLDSVLRRGWLTRDDFELMRVSARGRRGVRRSAGWWELADGRAQSPLETRIRILAFDAGLPPDELQLPVHDRHGVLLGYGDLAWHLPDGRVLVAEADGRGPHEQPAALFLDRRRANDFLATGWVDMVRFTWADTVVRAYVGSILRRHLPHLVPIDLERNGLRHGVS